MAPAKRNSKGAGKGKGKGPGHQEANEVEKRKVDEVENRAREEEEKPRKKTKKNATAVGNPGPSTLVGVAEDRVVRDNSNLTTEVFMRDLCHFTKTVSFCLLTFNLVFFR